MWKPEELNTDITLYVAIADEIEKDIRKGRLLPGEKMPPQRQLATTIGVNLTTITRAYKDAEKRGLLQGIMGKGTFVAHQGGINTRFPNVTETKTVSIDMGLVGHIKSDDDRIREIIQDVARSKELSKLLDYGPTQGMLQHRRIGAQWIERFGVQCHRDRVVICSGAMHAINCALLSMFEPGDRIAVDELTFSGFKSAARLMKIKLEPVAMDEGGMIPENLRNLCKRGGIKGIYLLPTINNPTTRTLSDHRKKAIASIIKEYNLTLIEDDNYNFIHIDNNVPVSAMVPDNSIYINSVSKVFYPGLRIAFVALAERFKTAFLQTVASSHWMASPMNCEIMCRCIEQGIVDTCIVSKKAIIADRVSLAREYLEGYDYEADDYGMFIWLHLPKPWTGADFENAAQERGVQVISSYKFFTGSVVPPHAVRISISSVDNREELRCGLLIIRSLLDNGYKDTMPVL